MAKVQRPRNGNELRVIRGTSDQARDMVLLPDEMFHADDTGARYVGAGQGGRARSLVMAEMNPDWGIVRPDMKSAGTSIVIFGSSSSERNNTSTSARFSNNGIGYFAWANAFLGDRLRLLRNAGISGNRVSEMAARLDVDVLAYRPDWVLYQMTPNDILADGMSASDCVAANIALIERIRTAGPRIALMLPHIWNSAYAGMSDARRAQFFVARRMMLDAVVNMPSVVPIDTVGLIVDPASAVADPLATMLADNQHTSSAGAAKIGWRVAQALDKFIPAVPWQCQSSADVWAATDENTQARRYLNPNPLLLGTGGTNGTGSSGEVANSTTVLREGGAGTVVASKIANPSGAGEGQRLTMTATAANTRFTLRQTIPNAAIPVAGRYRALATLALSGQTNVRSIYTWLSFNADAFIAGGLFRENSSAASASDQVLPWAALPGVIAPATPDVVLANHIASVTGNPVLNISVIFNAAGEGVLDVFDPAVIRLA